MRLFNLYVLKLLIPNFGIEFVLIEKKFEQQDYALSVGILVENLRK